MEYNDINYNDLRTIIKSRGWEVPKGINGGLPKKKELVEYLEYMEERNNPSMEKNNGIPNMETKHGISNWHKRRNIKTGE